jgi:two-component system chemotaxis response regulator CheY
MKVLVVEDDFVSRKLLQKLLGHYGECDVAVNGLEAVKAFKMALEEGSPYDLVCMDIMMPELDGQQALREIRNMERQKSISEAEGVKVIITTALDDPKNVVESLYKGGAASYVVKPIDSKKLVEEIRKLGFLG